MEVFRQRYKRIELPKDADGYTQSFADPDDPAAHDFFEKYGLVVISDALSEAQCENSVDEMWHYVEMESYRRPGEPCFMGNFHLGNSVGASCVLFTILAHCCFECNHFL
jgi:hypothetical protein